MIQEYLNEQFIRTSEDSNFEKIKKTSTELAKRISKDKALILAYSLIAFDPEVPADNKYIIEIKNLIIESWPTFLSSSKDTKLTIIRAVMLEALQLVSKEINLACLIWFASRNTFKYLKLGREKEILTSFMNELGNKIQAEVSESWNFSPDLEIDISKVASTLIKPIDLANWIENSIPVGTKNRHDIISKTLASHLSDLKLNQMQFLKVLSLMQMRTKLLWWKESGFSPLLKSSYKNINDGQLQVALAIDYSDFIPMMYPMSVDYFLLEVHRSFSQSEEKKMKISDFLILIEKCNSEIKKIVPEFTSDNNRISFTNFIQGFVNEKYQAKQFKNFVGVSDTTELSLGEFTLWLFHDLHSIKLSLSI